MVCCLFRRSSSSSASSTVINNVRVVDLNGYVEEFDYPVPVSQVTGRPPNHFVFTAAQLLSAASLKPLTAETLLEPGRIYFVLPASTFGHEFSPIDLAGIVKKLTAQAKSAGKSEANNSPRRKTLSPNPYSRISSSPAWNLPTRSPNRMADGVEKVSRKQSWRPILDTIREMSFRRSHSDLQEVLVLQDWKTM